ncbi:CNH-domain-containing protein [Rhizoclosmatium globosum]|uniref:CNH-domain-containing protein n=1 Tax=Rhizoclosmatium globosum TaxID=329046 RepID=A0A1Y2CS47_9FUNG|nr:CNH-domain-containing protein [Rhizoclosmatium globosum]|eukprot:ORY49821.1 CNH-domain-containing protein [Rhizoclosmatium globosum]
MNIGDNGEQTNDEELAAFVEEFCVGDVFLNSLEDFTVFEFYAANNESSRDAYLAEKKRNSKLKELVDRQMSSGKREEPIAYLTSIVKRFSDYKLNLEQVLKRTSDESPDAYAVREAVAEIGKIATRMNEATKLSQNQRIMQLYFRSTAPSANLDLLNLLDPSRQLIYKTPLNYTGRSRPVELIMFDNYIAIFIKTVDGNLEDEGDNEGDIPGIQKRYLYKIKEKPIHVDNARVLFDTASSRGITELLRHSTTTSAHSGTSTSGSHESPLIRHSSSAHSDKKSFTIQDFGNPFDADSHVATTYNFRVEVEVYRDQWKKQIEAHQKSQVFVDVGVCEDRVFVATRNAIFYGLEGSAYKRTPLLGSPSVSLGENIKQIEILEEFDLLLVLANDKLFAYNLRSVINKTSQASVRQQIAYPVNFFRIGVCDGKTLICAVGDTGLRWQMKLLDPTFKKAKKSIFSANVTQDMTVYKDIFIPTPVTSIDFLKMRVVIGTCRGFETVHMKLIGADGNAPLLDSTDPSLKFIRNRENLNPLALFRTDDERFLLCFEDQGFFVTKHGKYSLGSARFNWRGLAPSKFAHFGQYIVAVSRNVIDVFNWATGELVQSVVAENARVLEVRERFMYVSRDSGSGEDGTWEPASPYGAQVWKIELRV